MRLTGLTPFERIIVGVKYCFRYNARNRPRHDENGDPIDLAAMPRQHRRRREKKLMSLDEVNDRFPTTKYKAWVSSRAEEGLPTAGGVAAPSSRPASIKEPEQSSEEPAVPSPELGRQTTAASSKAKDEEKAAPAEGAPVTEGTTETTETQPVQLPVESVIPDEEVDEDDPIHAAVPAEMLNNPGDTCAICIDTLEDDDDVRALTCGHAFHASCVDPWLTSRRACCPLCKADYYVPKPRPEGEQSQEAERPVGRRTTNGRTDLQGAPPGLSILTGRREGRSRTGHYGGRYSRRNAVSDTTASTGASRFFFRLPRFPRGQSQPQTADGPAPEISTGEQQHWSTRFRPSIRRPNLSFLRRNQNASGHNGYGIDANPTPGELEAGSR